MTDAEEKPPVKYVVHYSSCGYESCFTVFLRVVDTEEEAIEMCKQDSSYDYEEVAYDAP